jgi:hypothetical protein
LKNPRIKPWNPQFPFFFSFNPIFQYSNIPSFPPSGTGKRRWRAKKNGNSYAIEIEKLGCHRWRLCFLVILLLGTALFFTIRWVIIQVETAEHDRRIGDLQVKNPRTIEEAAELAWRRENWPSESTVSWKRTHRQYYAQLGTKKVIGKWASIDVKMIFKADGRSCNRHFYFLEKGNDGAWKVIRDSGKFPWWDEIPYPEPEVPKDIRKQLGWW